MAPCCHHESRRDGSGAKGHHRRTALQPPALTDDAVSKAQDGCDGKEGVHLPGNKAMGRSSKPFGGLGRLLADGGTSVSQMMSKTYALCCPPRLAGCAHLWVGQQALECSAKAQQPLCRLLPKLHSGMPLLELRLKPRLRPFCPSRSRLWPSRGRCCRSVSGRCGGSGGLARSTAPQALLPPLLCRHALQLLAEHGDDEGASGVCK